MDDTVTRELDLDVDADDVWRTLADDDERGEWLGGDTSIELTPGGGGHVTDPDGTRRDVRVDEVDPGRHLSFDWWSDDDEPTHVSFTITATPSGSRLTVTERRLVPGARLTARAATMCASAGSPRLLVRA